MVAKKITLGFQYLKIIRFCKKGGMVAEGGYRENEKIDRERGRSSPCGMDNILGMLQHNLVKANGQEGE